MTRPSCDAAPASGLALREAAALACLALICCVFFWKAVTLQGAFFYYDHSIQNYPFRLFFAEGLGQGRFRLWTPDIFCGFPLFAESQGNAAYPPFLALFGLLKPWVAYNYYTVLHFLLAGVFTYILARLLRVGHMGSVLAGAIYMLAGPVLYHAHHTNIVVGASLLPLLLALIELVVRRRSLWPLLGFAVASAALALGAQPQYTLYCALVCGIYLAWRMHVAELSEGPGTTVRLLAAFALAGALSLALAAVQLAPLAELVGLSSRSGQGFVQPIVTGGSPGNLLTLMLPHYFGSPGLGSYWGGVGVGLHSEYTLFVGTASLLLALTGAFACRKRGGLFFAGLGLFAFLFSLDLSGGVYGVFSWLPIFRTSRFPQRFAFVTALCVGLLAGMGVDALVKSTDRRRVRKAAFLSAGMVLVMAILALAVTDAYQGDFRSLSRDQLAATTGLRSFQVDVLWRHFRETQPADILRLLGVVLAGTALLLSAATRALPRRACALLLCVLAIGELAWAGREFAIVTDPAIYTEPPALVRELTKLPPGRIFRFRYGDRLGPDVRMGDFPFTQGAALQPELYAGSLDKLPHNANMIWHVPSANGFSPLQTLALKTLLGQPENTNTLIEYSPSPLWGMLNARYLLTPRQSIPCDWPRVTRADGISVFENPDVMPRVRLVHRTKLIAHPDQAIATLRDPGFDHAREIVVHDRSALLPDGIEADPATESAQILSDTGDEIIVRAVVQAPAYLVLADQFYPGWQVEVDGEPGDVLRVNYLLKGVRLAPGEHELRFVFRPASFRVGLTLTCLGLATLVVGIVFAARGRTFGTAELAHVLDERYDRTTGRRFILLAFLFVGLGPVVAAGMWGGARSRITPWWYVAASARATARYYSADREPGSAYVFLRETFRRHPSSGGLRTEMVEAGADWVLALWEQGRLDEARQVARELVEIAPDEAELAGPLVRRLSQPQD